MPQLTPQQMQTNLQAVQAIVAEFEVKLANLKARQKELIDNFAEEVNKRKLKQLKEKM